MCLAMYSNSQSTGFIIRLSTYHEHGYLSNRLLDEPKSEIYYVEMLLVRLSSLTLIQKRVLVRSSLWESVFFIKLKHNHLSMSLANVLFQVISR